MTTGLVIRNDVNSIIPLKKEDGWHAKLSPSSLHAHSLCHGRFKAGSKAGKSRNTKASKEGTCAHFLFEELIKGTITTESVLKLDKFSDGIIDIDAKNIQQVVDTYLYVLAILNQYQDAYIYSELRVEPGFFYNGESMCSGTADVIIIVPSIRTAFVLDYKNGIIFVNEKANYQLAAYALGTYLMFKDQVQIDFITVVILQPRFFNKTGSYCFETYPASDLFTIWQPAIATIIHNSMDPNALRSASEKACLWCTAKSTCKVAAIKGFEDAARVFGEISKTTLTEVKANTLIDPNELTDEQIAVVLNSKDYISGWLKAVQQYAEERHKKHKPIAGFKLVRGRSARAWVHKEDGDMVKAFDKIMTLPQDSYYEKKLLSPAKFEKGPKRLLTINQWAMVDDVLIKKIEGSPTLVPESDNRKAINDPADVFSVIPAAHFNILD